MPTTEQELHAFVDDILLHNTAYMATKKMVAFITLDRLDTQIEEARWSRNEQEEIGMHDCCYGTDADLRVATDEHIAALESQRTKLTEVEKG